MKVSAEVNGVSADVQWEAMKVDERSIAVPSVVDGEEP